ncbi:hypothetical protein [uncultured Clostridium sp.]|uniref:hypothetical protein n=1 Tax=uncultured Clostridium sp. TaxID=59620 RepID=UPI00261F7072|nr:hypothetical protein [uncultured Clostridium sp.]
MFIKEYLKYFKKALPLGIVIGQILIFFQLAQKGSIGMEQFFLLDFIPVISLGYLFGCEYIYTQEGGTLKKKTLVQTILLLPLYFIYLKLGIIEWQIIVVGNIIWILIVVIKEWITAKKDKEDAKELNELLKKWTEE